jgi:hypothetical protein
MLFGNMTVCGNREFGFRAIENHADIFPRRSCGSRSLSELIRTAEARSMIPARKKREKGTYPKTVVNKNIAFPRCPPAATD